MESTTPGLWKSEFGELGATLKALQDRGVTLEHLARLRSDAVYADKVAASFRGEVETVVVFQSTPSQIRARQIMGRNFLGVEEAVRHLKVNPSEADLQALAEVPFSEEVLTSCKNTHVLVADFGLSICDVRSRVKRQLFYRHEDAWYNGEEFAKKTSKPCWRLLAKTAVPASFIKTFADQQALLNKDEEVPEARVVVYTIILYYLATGERLFDSCYVRCSDTSSDGNRVNVGYFDSDGLLVNDYWGGDADDGVGLASARKPCTTA